MSEPHVPKSRTDEIDRTDERESPARRPADRRANMPAPPGAVQRGTTASRGAARDEMEPAHPNRAARDVMEPVEPNRAARDVMEPVEPDRAARDVMEPAEPHAARDVMQPAHPDRAARDVMEPDPRPQAPETD